MFHPIFSTVLGHPELVADHLANYASLIREETVKAGRGVILRVVAGAVAIASALLALGLIGVAVMLGFLNGSFHWVLAIVPGVSVIIAAVAGFIAVRPAAFHGFEDLRAQVDADLRAIHVAGQSHG